jgi:mRNA interferase RelE/StbE
MRNFRLQLTKSAGDDLNSSSADQRKKILDDVKSLSSNPLSFGIKIKKLRGFRPPLYRLRSGDYRVLYRVQGDITTIMRIIDRKDLERIIKRIKR